MVLLSGAASRLAVAAVALGASLFAVTPGPAAAVSAPLAISADACEFMLGFSAIAGIIPQNVGQCTDAESHNPQNGDALQHTTTGGLLVWRKSDNWTAFTDGHRTWVNGP